MPGVGAFLFRKRKILLVLRDDKPDIPWPNSWCTPTEQIEQGESHLEAMKRGLKEELNIVTCLHLLGFTPKENAYYFGVLSALQVKAIVHDKEEGQGYNFFSYDELGSINIGATLKTYFECPERTRVLQELFTTKVPPKPGKLFGFSSELIVLAKV